jgi:hypothetical protein
MMCSSGRRQAIPLATKPAKRWLRGRIQEGMGDGRVSTEWFVRLADAGDDYAYGCRSPPWGITMDHLSVDVVFM